MALSYRQVSDLYDILHSAGAVNTSLADWSMEQNRNSESDLYSAGLHDNWIKRMSTNIDRGLEWTGAPDVTEGFGRSVGELIGAPEQGAAVGRSLPRTAVDFAPMMATAALAPVTGGTSLSLLPFLGLGTSAALSGANAYTETDSPVAGLIGAGTAIAMPGVASLAERAAFKALGAPVIRGMMAPVDDLVKAAGMTSGELLGKASQVERVIPRTFTQGIGGMAAGQVAAGAFGEATNVASSLMSGQDYEFDPKALALGMTLGQLPFAGMYLGAHARQNMGGKASRELAQTMEHRIVLTEGLIKTKKIMEDNAKTGGLEAVPDFVGPKMPLIEADINHKINVLAGTLKPLENEGTAPSVEELARRKAELDATLLEVGISPDVTFYRKIDENTERRSVTGEILQTDPNGTWRKIKVANEPANGELAGKTVFYSTLHEKAPEKTAVEGAFVIDLPGSNFHSVVPDDYVRKLSSRQQRRAGTGVDELPLTNDPANRSAERASRETDQYDYVRLLNDLESDYIQAPTQEDRFQAMNRLNFIRASMDMKPLTNEMLEKRSAQDAIRMTKAAARGREVLVERVTKGNEFAATVHKAATDPNNPDPVSKAIWDLRETFLRVGENRARIVDSGIFDERAERWMKGKGGTLENFEAFKGGFGEMIDKGKGLPKTKVQDVLSNALKEVEVLPYEEKAPIITTWRENAMEMVYKIDDPSVKAELIDAIEAGQMQEVADILREIGMHEEGEQIVKATQFKYDESKKMALRQEAWRNKVTGEISYTVPDSVRIVQDNPSGSRAVQTADGQFFFGADHGDAWKKAREAGAVGPYVRGFVTADGQFKNFLQITQEAGNWEQLGSKKMALNDVGKRALRLPIADHVPLTPEHEEIIKATGTTGESLLQYVQDTASKAVGTLSAESPLRGLMEDLRKLSNGLSRISVRFVETDNASSAFRRDGRRVEIQLSPSTLAMSAEGRATEFAHELLHGLSVHQLDSDNAAKARLEGFRLRMFDKLPANLKSVARMAEQTDWYNRYARGEASVEEIVVKGLTGAKQEQAQRLIYGMLNADEFMSMGFTDPVTREFLKAQKGTKGLSGWQEFTNWVGSLLGLTKTTGLDEFMFHAGKILNDSERLASVQNYAEGYFKGKGSDETKARFQANRVTGLVQESEAITSSHDLVSRIAEQVHLNADLKAATNATKKVWDTESDDRGLVNILLENFKQKPTFKGFQQFVREIISGDVGSMKDVVEILPDSVKGMLFEQASDAHEIVNVLKLLSTKRVNDVVGATELTNLSKLSKETLKNIKAVVAMDEEGQKLKTKLAGLMGVAPDGFLDALIGTPKKALLVPMEGDQKTKMGLIEKFLARPAQIARMYPEVAEAVVKGYNLMAASRKHALEGFKAFGYDLTTGKITGPAVDLMHKAISNRKLARGVDEYIYLNQKHGGDNVVTLPSDHADVKKLLSRFSPKEQEQIRTLVAQKEFSQIAMNNMALESMRQVSETNAAILIAKTSGLKLGLNGEAAKGVFEFYLTDFSDPQAAEIAKQKLAQIQAKMSPDTFSTLFKFVGNEAKIYQNWQEHFKTNPAWSTARRYGKFDVYFANGDRDAFDSKAEADLAAKERGTKVVSLEKRGDNTDIAHFGAGSESLIARGRELEENRMSMMRDSGLFDSEQLDAMKRASAIEQLAVEARAAGVKDVSSHSRRLTKGAESVSYLSNHFSWITKNSTFWARQKYMADVRLLLMDPQLEGRKDLKDWVKTHAENILRPDPEGARVMTTFTTNWLMGFNPASAIANGTQLVLRGASEMTNLTGRPIESFKRMAAAIKTISSTRGNKWVNPEHSWLMERATADGEIGLSVYDTEPAVNETIATNLKRGMAKHTQQTLAQHLQSGAGSWSTAAMWMFRQVEQLNTRGAILAGFDFYRSKGLGMTESYEKAREFNHMINDTGGRVNRSVGLFSGKDAFSRSTAMIANSMQSYMLGSTFQLVHYIKSGFFRPQGLTPSEIANARTAAVQMLAVQFTAAGMLGMPFVASIMAILDKQFPSLEVNKNVRLWSQKLLGSDGENGNILGDIALTGLPSAFGWDWQSRLSAGNSVPGVTELNGFQPGNLLGAPANIVSQFVTGAAQLAQGDVQGARKLLPPAIKKITDLITNDGMVKDYRDRPIFTPTRGEQLGMALGLNPKRLSDANAATRISAQSDKIATRRAVAERQEMANRAMKGDFGTVRQDLLKQAQLNPSMDLRAEVKAVVKLAEEMTFMRDLRRDGKDSSKKLLDALNVPMGETNETARLQFRQGMEQRLGLRSTGNGEARMAQLMDQLKAQRPDASRMELRRAAEAVLRGPRKQPGLEE